MTGYKAPTPYAPKNVLETLLPAVNGTYLCISILNTTFLQFEKNRNKPTIYDVRYSRIF